jgi:acetamidase/formamidase/AraC-like DNA-binding protein
MNRPSDPISISAFPKGKQEGAWQETLRSLSIIGRHRDETGFDFGEIATRSLPTGAKATLLRSTAQDFAGLPGRKDTSILIGFVQYGRGHIGDGGRRVSEFADGDLWVCDAQTPWSLQFRNDFELLLLQLPRERMAGRMGRAPVVSGTVLGETVAAAAARPVMRVLASQFAMAEDGDLIAGEIAVTELVVSSMLAEARPDEDSATQVQAGHFARVCAIIEARLRDPDLSIACIAKEEGLSPRYIQRLFEGHDRSFSEHVRHRRLEHCRLELVNPQHADRSIAEIAFRWGFPDQAHFSRVFSAAYGTSPRDFRKSAPELSTTRWTRGRPLHTGTRPGTKPAVPLIEEPALVAPSRPAPAPTSTRERHHIAVSRDTVHWGYLSRSIPPVLRVRPNAEITVETLTQHAYDDEARMISGDAGAESVFAWTPDYKAVDRRGAGPMNATIFGRGAGEGFGVHICTGPIYVHGAEPGDVLEVQILDIRPRPCANPEFAGYAFGSNVAGAWGYHYDDMLDGPRNREIVTIFRTEADGSSGFAEAVYSYRWAPQTDPFGIVHETIDYPGVPIDRATIQERTGFMEGLRVPIRPHFGFIAVAPREVDIVDTVPPGYFGGNIDNWRAGKGSSLYLPVAVPGALLSIGDPHLAQGDGEISGTALECSLTGDIRLVLHKRNETGKAYLNGLSSPLLETPDEWIVHGFSYPNYLRELGRNAQSEVFKKSSLDRAMKTAFRTARKFLMECFDLDEDEAVSLMSVAVDFGVTQVADGNWGVHAVIRKSVVSSRAAAMPPER